MSGYSAYMRGNNVQKFDFKEEVLISRCRQYSDKRTSVFFLQSERLSSIVSKPYIQYMYVHRNRCTYTYIDIHTKGRVKVLRLDRRTFELTLWV